MSSKRNKRNAARDSKNKSSNNAKSSSTNSNNNNNSASVTTSNNSETNYSSAAKAAAQVNGKIENTSNVVPGQGQGDHSQISDGKVSSANANALNMSINSANSSKVDVNNNNLVNGHCNLPNGNGEATIEPTGLYQNTRMLQLLYSCTGADAKIQLKNGAEYKGFFNVVNEKGTVAISSAHKSLMSHTDRVAAKKAQKEQRKAQAQANGKSGTLNGPTLNGKAVGVNGHDRNQMHQNYGHGHGIYGQNGEKMNLSLAAAMAGKPMPLVDIDGKPLPAGQAPTSAQKAGTLSITTNDLPTPEGIMDQVMFSNKDFVTLTFENVSLKAAERKFEQIVAEHAAIQQAETAAASAETNKTQQNAASPQQLQVGSGDGVTMTNSQKIPVDKEGNIDLQTFARQTVATNSALPLQDPAIAGAIKNKDNLESSFASIQQENGNSPTTKEKESGNKTNKNETAAAPSTSNSNNAPEPTQNSNSKSNPTSKKDSRHTFKTDEKIASEVKQKRANKGEKSKDKKLEKWVPEVGDEDSEKYQLDNGPGWAPDDMFDANTSKYNYRSQYNEDGAEYTNTGIEVKGETEMQRRRRIERAENVAKEIETKGFNKRALEHELDEGMNEEDKFSAVDRQDSKSGRKSDYNNIQNNQNRYEPSDRRQPKYNDRDYDRDYDQNQNNYNRYDNNREPENWENVKIKNSNRYNGNNARPNENGHGKEDLNNDSLEKSSSGKFRPPSARARENYNDQQQGYNSNNNNGNQNNNNMMMNGNGKKQTYIPPNNINNNKPYVPPTSSYAALASRTKPDYPANGQVNNQNQNNGQNSNAGYKKDKVDELPNNVRNVIDQRKNLVERNVQKDKEREREAAKAFSTPFSTRNYDEKDSRNYNRPSLLPDPPNNTRGQSNNLNLGQVNNSGTSSSNSSNLNSNRDNVNMGHNISQVNLPINNGIAADLRNNNVNGQGVGGLGSPQSIYANNKNPIHPSQGGPMNNLMNTNPVIKPQIHPNNSLGSLPTNNFQQISVPQIPLTQVNKTVNANTQVFNLETLNQIAAHGGLQNLPSHFMKVSHPGTNALNAQAAAQANQATANANVRPTPTMPQTTGTPNNNNPKPQDSTIYSNTTQLKISNSVVNDQKPSAVAALVDNVSKMDITGTNQNESSKETSGNNTARNEIEPTPENANLKDQKSVNEVPAGTPGTLAVASGQNLNRSESTQSVDKSKKMSLSATAAVFNPKAAIFKPRTPSVSTTTGTATPATPVTNAVSIGADGAVINETGTTEAVTMQSAAAIDPMVTQTNTVQVPIANPSVPTPAMATGGIPGANAAVAAAAAAGLGLPSLNPGNTPGLPSNLDPVALARAYTMTNQMSQMTPEQRIQVIQENQRFWAAQSQNLQIGALGGKPNLSTLGVGLPANNFPVQIDLTGQNDQKVDPGLAGAPPNQNISMSPQPSMSSKNSRPPSQAPNMGIGGHASQLSGGLNPHLANNEEQNQNPQQNMNNHVSQVNIPRPESMKSAGLPTPGLNPALATQNINAIQYLQTQNQNPNNPHMPMAFPQQPPSVPLDPQVGVGNVNLGAQTPALASLAKNPMLAQNFGNQLPQLPTNSNLIPNLGQNVSMLQGNSQGNLDLNIIRLLQSTPNAAGRPNLANLAAAPYTQAMIASQLSNINVNPITSAGPTPTQIQTSHINPALLQQNNANGNPTQPQFLSQAVTGNLPQNIIYNPNFAQLGGAQLGGNVGPGGNIGLGGNPSNGNPAHINLSGPPNTSSGQIMTSHANLPGQTNHISHATHHSMPGGPNGPNPLISLGPSQIPNLNQFSSMQIPGQPGNPGLSDFRTNQLQGLPANLSNLGGNINAGHPNQMLGLHGGPGQINLTPQQLGNPNLGNPMQMPGGNHMQFTQQR